MRETPFYLLWACCGVTEDCRRFESPIAMFDFWAVRGRFSSGRKPWGRPDEDVVSGFSEDEFRPDESFGGVRTKVAFLATETFSSPDIWTNGRLTTGVCAVASSRLSAILLNFSFNYPILPYFPSFWLQKFTKNSPCLQA